MAVKAVWQLTSAGMAHLARVEIRPHKIMLAVEVEVTMVVVVVEQEVVAGAVEARLRLAKSALMLKEPVLALDQ